MQKTTPIFPGFHEQTLRRKPQSAQKKLATEMDVLRQKSFSQLATYMERIIPQRLLQRNETGAHSRTRVFSKPNTFWAFFMQVLDTDGGCMETVKRLQAYAGVTSSNQLSSSTGSYCKARAKLTEEDLHNILSHTVKRANLLPENEPLNKRRVIVVDGTGISMPDTPANQSEWPQTSMQKPGCGFPTARICACFSLETGHVLSYELGNKKSHELRLLRKQHSTFQAGDIFLGDKGFCSYYDVSTLQKMGVDSVITLARRTPVRGSECIKKLANDDLLIAWKKPSWQARLAYSREEWEKLPSRLRLRQIKVTVDQPGFRVKSFYIITTLTDVEEYPAAEIAELYFRRWEVELNFRDLKTTMGMDILRCKIPSMIRKEILMHFIAYNAIRTLIYEAAEERGVEPRRVSFKGALQSLRHWERCLPPKRVSQSEKLRLVSMLYDSISQSLIPSRPGRREPRCVKRRPKPYQYLTAPRHQMKETQHRDKYSAKRA